MVTEPRRVKLNSDRDVVEALDAVHADSVPRVIERDGEAIAAIVSVKDLERLTEFRPSKEAIARALAAAGSWRDLGGEEIAEKIARWRHESPPSPPVEL